MVTHQRRGAYAPLIRAISSRRACRSSFPGAVVAMSTLLVSAYAPPDTAVGMGTETGKYYLGQALEEHEGELPYFQPKNEQGMVHTAINRTGGVTVLLATFFEVPPTGPLTIPVEAPANCTP